MSPLIGYSMKSGQPGNYTHANSKKEKLSRLYLYIILCKHTHVRTHTQVTIVKEKEEINWKVGEGHGRSWR